MGRLARGTVLAVSEAGAGLGAVYPSLGIGTDRLSQYQEAWRAAMKG